MQEQLLLSKIRTGRPQHSHICFKWWYSITTTNVSSRTVVKTQLVESGAAGVSTSPGPRLRLSQGGSGAWLCIDPDSKPSQSSNPTDLCRATQALVETFNVWTYHVGKVNCNTGLKSLCRKTCHTYRTFWHYIILLGTGNSTSNEMLQERTCLPRRSLSVVVSAVLWRTDVWLAALSVVTTWAGAPFKEQLVRYTEPSSV